jgi:hypothetical protein
VHEAVESTKVVNDARYKLVVRPKVRDVTRDREMRLVARQLGAQSIQCLRVKVGRRHASTGLCKGMADSPTDATARPGNEMYPAVETEPHRLETAEVSHAPSARQMSVPDNQIAMPSDSRREINPRSDPGRRWFGDCGAVACRCCSMGHGVSMAWNVPTVRA